jgi:hypothetical protein
VTKIVSCDKNNLLDVCVLGFGYFYEEHMEPILVLCLKYDNSVRPECFDTPPFVWFETPYGLLRTNGFMDPVRPEERALASASKDTNGSLNY